MQSWMLVEDPPICGSWVRGPLGACPVGQAGARGALSNEAPDLGSVRPQRVA